MSNVTKRHPFPFGRKGAFHWRANEEKEDNSTCGKLGNQEAKYNFEGSLGGIPCVQPQLTGLDGRRTSQRL